MTEQPTKVMRARRNSICPLCTKYVLRGKSKIAALPVALPPTDEQVFWSEEDGRWRERWRGGTTHVDAREWGHERCVRRWLRQTAGQDRYALARQRREALERMRGCRG
jgi:hypothetical protein